MSLFLRRSTRARKLEAEAKKAEAAAKDANTREEEAKEVTRQLMVAGWLYEAADAGDEMETRRLLADGADPNWVNSNVGFVPLSQ